MFVEMKNPFQEDKSRKYLFFGSAESIMVDSVIAVMRSEERRRYFEKCNDHREKEEELFFTEEKVEDFPCKKEWRYDSSAQKRNLHHRKDRAKKYNAKWHGTKCYSKCRKSALLKKETERIDRASAENDLTWEQAYSNAETIQRIAESISAHEQELEDIYKEKQLLFRAMQETERVLRNLKQKESNLEDLLSKEKKIMEENIN